jgi:hypothetical protein
MSNAPKTILVGDATLTTFQSQKKANDIVAGK